MTGSLSFGNALVAQLLDGAPDPTVVVDVTGTIVLVNSQVEHVFGYPRGELEGRPIEVLVPQRFRAGHPALRNGFLKNPTERPLNVARELTIVHHDGREMPVEITLAPLQTEAGLLVSTSIRDVTERNRALREAARLREELIATVSHELRTPLASIIGYAELLGDLDEHDLSSRARRLLDVIQRNAARELRLVDDLLTMAFLDGKRLRIAIGPVNLADVARRVLVDLRSRARQKGIDFALVGDPVPAVAGDFYRLVQVLENLVSNAFKFTPPGGRVTVSVRSEGGMGVVEVSDTGPGVTAEERDRIFERLYRSPHAVAAHTPGAGLGLSIVQKIVESHEGSVDVESEVGVGTTFIVRVPHVAPADQPPIDRPAGEPPLSDPVGR